MYRESNEIKLNKSFVIFNPVNLYCKSKNVENEEICNYIYKNMKNSRPVTSLIIPEHVLSGINYNYFELSNEYKILHKLIENGTVKNIWIGTSIILNNKSYNAVITISKHSKHFKFKKVLVPYIEYLNPFISKLLNKKTFTNIGKDSTSEIIKKYKITPLICYESAYPNYVCKASNNSDLIIVFTSEQFLNNSKYGASQYNNIIQLRALENNIPILKAAAFGESIYFNNRGKILKKENLAFNYFEI